MIHNETLMLIMILFRFGKETKEWSSLDSLAPKLPHYLFVRGKLPSGEFTISSVSE
jgi:hypothetical protein